MCDSVQKSSKHMSVHSIIGNLLQKMNRISTKIESIPSYHLRLVCDLYNPMIHTSTVHGRGNSASDFQSRHQYNDVLIRKKYFFFCALDRKKSCAGGYEVNCLKEEVLLSKYSANRLTSHTDLLQN